MTSLAQIDAIFAPALKSIEAMNNRASAVLADIQEVRREAEALQACAEKARDAFAAESARALPAAFSQSLIVESNQISGGVVCVGGSRRNRRAIGVVVTSERHGHLSRRGRAPCPLF